MKHVKRWFITVLFVMTIPVSTLFMLDQDTPETPVLIAKAPDNKPDKPEKSNNNTDDQPMIASGYGWSD